MRHHRQAAWNVHDIPATTPHRTETTPLGPSETIIHICAFTRAKVDSIDCYWMACVDWVTPAVATVDLHGKMVVNIELQ